MIKILLGGSPCTYWSIAQKNNRETEPSGLGWELFKNYLIAKEKFKPDIFLYENNKSAAQPIKAKIREELKVWDGSLFMKDTRARYIEINSALVSAQNRQRFYVHNCGEVEQPKDRGIVLRDILETTTTEQGYELNTNSIKPICFNIPQQVKVRKYTCDIEKLKQLLRNHKIYTNKYIANELKKPVTLVEHWFRKDKSFAVPDSDVWFDLKKLLKIETTEFDDYVTVFEMRNGNFEKADRVYDVKGKMSTLMTGTNDNIIEPIRIGEIGKGGQGNRIYSFDGKGVTITANGGGIGSNTGLYADPVRIGDIGSTAQAHRVYSCDGKSVTINAGGGGQGGKTGLYACPFYKLSEEYYKGSENLIGMITDGEGKYRNGNQPSQQYRVYNCEGKSQVVNTLANENYIVPTNAKLQPIYNVKNGLITIKGKQYPIKLADGYYIIRKLTVTECCRLQTMPDNYCRAVSNSQAYKGLGNGWTSEVIIHILSNALKDIPKDEEIVVLSMYDGIGTGRYCLDKMGFTNVKYYAYEIDKYAMQIAMSNYPDIIQCGDAFQVRNDDWNAPK